MQYKNKRVAFLSINMNHDASALWNVYELRWLVNFSSRHVAFFFIFTVLQSNYNFFSKMAL